MITDQKECPGATEQGLSGAKDAYYASKRGFSEAERGYLAANKIESTAVTKCCLLPQSDLQVATVTATAEAATLMTLMAQAAEASALTVAVVDVTLKCHLASVVTLTV
jgi:hypothetical protein